VLPRVGLLTGTFDPVHLGHVALARAARRQLELNEVWLLANPQAVLQDSAKVGVAAFTHRLAMARLAVANEPGIRVYDGDLVGWPHEWATFAELAKLEHMEPVFVLGMDALGHLDRWKDVESVVRNSTFAAAQRSVLKNYSLSELRLGLLGQELRVQEFVPLVFAEVSSSEVKTQLRAGETPPGLDGQVLEYVLAHGLYL
jgi:nicotinate-nucleotide adenylyltransferase